MKKISLKNLPLLVLATALLLSSCQKEKVSPVMSEPKNFAKDEASLDKMFVRREMILTALSSGSASFKMETANEILSCAEVSTDSVHMPHTTVINYGLTGCVGSDGVMRRGKVVITFDGDYHDAGTIIVTTFSHYYEDSDEITGSDTMHNMGLNGNDHIVFTVSLNYNIIFGDGSGIEKHVMTGTCEWLGGDATETTSDDQYASVINRDITLTNGDIETWTSNSSYPVIIDLGCAYTVVDGKITCHRPSSFDSLWDYGDGTCDNLAYVTENGVTTEVTTD
jgi:hypothetical protein